MWVYGDQERTATAAREAARLWAAAAEADRLPPGIARHGAAVGVLVAASELVQGVLDADMEAAGRDRAGPLQDAGGRLLLSLARSVEASRRTGFAGAPLDLGGIRGALAALALARPLRLRRAEGHAFYAVYPEAYAAAAERSGLGPGTRVVGIRSIGCGLAGMVAAALGAAPPVFLRPVGDPFDRRIEADGALVAAVAGDGPVAVVDEGPGLSGSSFAAVVRRLEAAGVEPERIHLFPSHAGDPGPEASAEVRATFARTRRHVAGLEAVTGRDGDGTVRLAGWVEALAGALDGPPQDLSGGRWRALLGRAPEDLPAVDAGRERLKWRFSAGGRPIVARFAGLGAEGPRKLADARRLSTEGLVPRPLGLVHGFLIEEWVEGDRLDLAAGGDRRGLAAALGRHLGRRAALLEPATGGASLETLAAMTRRNAALAIGDEAAARLAARLDGIARLEPRLRRVSTDGRLQPVEWIAAGSAGRLVKTDGLDHGSAHDLVGCQDIGWDVALASLEFGFDAGEDAALTAAVEAAGGPPVDRDLVEALRPCVAAFQVGLWATASGAGPGDEARIARRRRSFEAVLRRLAGGPGGG